MEAATLNRGRGRLERREGDEKGSNQRSGRDRERGVGDMMIHISLMAELVIVLSSLLIGVVTGIHLGRPRW